MKNFLHEEKNTFFCKIINQICVVFEIIAS